MKNARITTLIVGILILSTGLVMAQGRNAQGRGGSGSGSECSQALMDRLDILVPDTLDEGEIDGLIHMREEEKLARDVYVTLSLKWNLPIFSNIARAEQRHMDLVALLLTRYDLEDPVNDDSVGLFSDPNLAGLFESLVAAGEESLLSALAVGATIEDLDLADLYTNLDDGNNADIALVYQNLAKGSRNHLRAFLGAIAANGGEQYVAQYLTQQEVDEINASDRERGVVYDEFGDVLATCDVTAGGRGRGRGRNGGGNGNRGGNGNGGNGNGGNGSGVRDGSCLAGS